MFLTILSLRWLEGILYLDPGSGSFILQLLIAALLGAGLAIKIYWRKLVAFFKKEQPESSQPAEVTDESNSTNDDQ